MDLTQTSETRARTTPAPRVPAWQDAPLAALVAHIVDEHHACTRRALRQIAPLFDRALARHAHRHPFLRELAVLYEGLAAELEENMLEEEEQLFPRALSPNAPLLQHHLALMRHAHETALAVLHRMRELTRGYRPLRGAGEAQALFAALEALERDLRRHIHLEREVLLPRLGAR